MEWLSVAQVSDQIDIPVETVRRYINRHAAHLQVKKVSKAYFLSDQCVDVLGKIRYLYAEGKQSDEVSACLDRLSVPTTIEIEDKGTYKLDAQLELRLNMIASMLMSIDERLKVNETFREEVAADLEQIRGQVSVVKDELVMKSSTVMMQLTSIEDQMRKNQDDVEQKFEAMLSRVETHSKRGQTTFWNRLFGKNKT